MVEQRTENPRVSGSTPLLGTGGSSSAVERLLAKEKVVGPNPIFRSSRSGGMVDAAVSKTVGRQLSCRFESDLRHQAKPWRRDD